MYYLTVCRIILPVSPHPAGADTAGSRTRALAEGTGRPQAVNGKFNGIAWIEFNEIGDTDVWNVKQICHEFTIENAALFHLLVVIGSRKMMSNVMRSVPAFLLRMVLARSTSFTYFIGLISLINRLFADFGHGNRKQLQRIVHLDGMVHGPGICVGYRR